MNSRVINGIDAKMVLNAIGNARAHIPSNDAELPPETHTIATRLNAEFGITITPAHIFALHEYVFANEDSHDLAHQVYDALDPLVQNL